MHCSAPTEGQVRVIRVGLTVQAISTRELHGKSTLGWRAIHLLHTIRDVDVLLAPSTETVGQQASRLQEMLVAVADREAVTTRESSDGVRRCSLGDRGLRIGRRGLHDRRRGCENLLPVA